MALASALRSLSREVRDSEHCQQLIPTGTTILTPLAHRPTAPHSHIPVDPQLIQTHASPPYAPVSVASDATHGSIVANRTDSSASFGDFKATSFHNSLLTARKGIRQSSHITIGSRRPLPTSSQQHDSKQRPRNRKAKQSEKLIPPSDDHPLSPQLPAPVVRKYSLKLVISHADTPFQHEVVPDTEEWSPTEEDIQYRIGGIFLAGCLGHIIGQTGLWDSVIIMQPECRYIPYN